ncbi:Ran guanine nucleotide release factor, partial [Globisporangium splendens]
MTGTTTRVLFGGALSCAIPEGFADVSSFRQVPDNQEVFANAQTDQCVIVELLQYEDDVLDDESARFFFNEIAASNGCNPDDVSILCSELLAANDGPAISATHTNSIVVGDQRVAKFKEGESAKNVVRVYLGNIRLPSVATDVVISVSVPLQISAASSSAGSFQFENSAEIGAALFMQVVKSFAVHDWSLFG